MCQFDGRVNNTLIEKILCMKRMFIFYHNKKSLSPRDETIRNVFLIYKHNNVLFASISLSILLWVANKNSRVDLERNTFVGIPNSLDSNINNAVTTNFSLLMLFETMFK